MKNNFIKIWLGISVFSLLLISCTSIKKLIPRQPRPFQKRAFDSKLWLSGDSQTRGEMSEDLTWKKDASGNYLLPQKTQAEILALLGQPDRKTRGKCCGAGGTFDEEVWLYDLEVQRESGSSRLTEEHFQLYFTPQNIVDEMKLGLWDDQNPDYYPRIG